MAEARAAASRALEAAAANQPGKGIFNSSKAENSEYLL